LSPRTRKLLVFAAKVAVATVLIGWLVRNGTLKFSALRILVDKPVLLALDLAVYFGGVVIGAQRWRILLGLAKVKVGPWRAIQLQSTAIFFNVVVPGNIGGDLVKSLYIARDEPAKRAAILLVAFVDRLSGLGGLVMMALAVTWLRPALWGDPLLRPLATTIAILGAGLVLGTAAFVIFMRAQGEHIEKWTNRPGRIAGILNQLVAALRLVSAGPMRLVGALLLSMGYHATGLAFFTVLTQAITGVDAPFSALATVFPLGILTLVLPIAPAGLGVGHVAFGKLFEMIGLTGGATVFNVYILGLLVPGLSGVVPYLALKRAGGVPDAP